MNFGSRRNVEEECMKNLAGMKSHWNEATTRRFGRSFDNRSLNTLWALHFKCTSLASQKKHYMAFSNCAFMLFYSIKLLKTILWHQVFPITSRDLWYKTKSLFFCFSLKPSISSTMLAQVRELNNKLKSESWQTFSGAKTMKKMSETGLRSSLKLITYHSTRQGFLIMLGINQIFGCKWLEISFHLVVGYVVVETDFLRFLCDVQFLVNL